MSEESKRAIFFIWFKWNFDALRIYIFVQILTFVGPDRLRRRLHTAIAVTTSIFAHYTLAFLFLVHATMREYLPTCNKWITYAASVSECSEFLEEAMHVK